MDDVSTSASFFDVGASIPPPSAQPQFNSPVTQDSFSVLDTVSASAQQATTTLGSIFSSGASLLTSLTNAKAQTNAASQAAQLSAQQQSSTKAVVLAQSTAQQKSAQVNANIASALASFTGSPIVAVVLGILLLSVVARKVI